MRGGDCVSSTAIPCRLPCCARPIMPLPAGRHGRCFTWLPSTPADDCRQPDDRTMRCPSGIDCIVFCTSTSEHAAHPDAIAMEMAWAWRDTLRDCAARRARRARRGWVLGFASPHVDTASIDPQDSTVRHQQHASRNRRFVPIARSLVGIGEMRLILIEVPPPKTEHPNRPQRSPANPAPRSLTFQLPTHSRPAAPLPGPGRAGFG